MRRDLQSEAEVALGLPARQGRVGCDLKEVCTSGHSAAVRGANAFLSEDKSDCATGELVRLLGGEPGAKEQRSHSGNTPMPAVELDSDVRKRAGMLVLLPTEGGAFAHPDVVAEDSQAVAAEQPAARRGVVQTVGGLAASFAALQGGGSGESGSDGARKSVMSIFGVFRPNPRKVTRAKLDPL